MARRLRTVTIVMLLAILFGGVVAYLMTQECSRMPIQHFGIADPILLGETTTMQASQLAAMKAIGISSVRVDADWGSVQAAGAGTFDWTRLDRAVRSARAAGMLVDLIIDGCPRWAALAWHEG